MKTFKELNDLGNQYLQEIKKKPVGKILNQRILDNDKVLEHETSRALNGQSENADDNARGNDERGGEVHIKSPKSLGVSIIEQKSRTNIRVNNSSLPPINKEKRDSPSPNKINYLPDVREYLKKKKKLGEFEGVIENNCIPEGEKFKIVKSGIEKIEQNVKFIEKKMKYTNDRRQMEEDRASLDKMYMETIKAKIAILNGLGT